MEPAQSSEAGQSGSQKYLLTSNPVIMKKYAKYGAIGTRKIRANDALFTAYYGRAGGDISSSRSTNGLLM